MSYVLAGILLAVVCVKQRADAYPVDVTSCLTGNGDWFIEDDTDTTFYWRCYSGGMWVQQKCAVGSCVTKGYGAINHVADPSAAQPCGSHCMNGMTPMFTTPGPIVDQSFYCHFEADMCGMTADPTTGYMWKRGSGPTFIPGTGPSVDHTYYTATAFYLLAQSFDGSAGDTARVVSADYSGSQPLHLQFFYNMWGADVDSLTVYVRKNADGTQKVVWRNIGGGTDIWRDAQVALPGGIAGGYKVVIEARNGGFAGDIAIDDLTINPNTAVAGTDCGSLAAMGNVMDGWYKLRLAGGQEISVWCDLDFQRTYIQKRDDGAVSFDRTLAEYAAGFGSPSGDYWMGLDQIHTLTNSGTTYNLVVQLRDTQGVSYEARYGNFRVGDAASGYQLTLGSYLSGTAGDALLNSGFAELNSANMKFTTKDLDQDMAPVNCAQTHTSGWWYNDCFGGNVNAPWILAGQTACYGNGCISWKPLGSMAFNMASMSVEKV